MIVLSRVRCASYTRSLHIIYQVCTGMLNTSIGIKENAHSNPERMRECLTRIYALMAKHCSFDALTPNADAELQELQHVLLKVSVSCAIGGRCCFLQTATVLISGGLMQSSDEEEGDDGEVRLFCRVESEAAGLQERESRFTPARVSPEEARTLLHHCDAAIIGKSMASAQQRQQAHAARSAAFSLLSVLVKVFFSSSYYRKYALTASSVQIGGGG